MLLPDEWIKLFDIVMITDNDYSKDRIYLVKKIYPHRDKNLIAYDLAWLDNTALLNVLWKSIVKVKSNYKIWDSIIINNTNAHFKFLKKWDVFNITNIYNWFVSVIISESVCKIPLSLIDPYTMINNTLHDFKIGEVITYTSPDKTKIYYYYILKITWDVLELLEYGWKSDSQKITYKHFNKISYRSIPQPVVNYFNSISKWITNMEKLIPEVNSSEPILNTNTNNLMSTTLDKITIEKFYSNEKNVEAVTITKEELEYYYESLDVLVNIFSNYKAKVNRMQLDFNNAISSDNIKEIKSLIKVTWSRLDALQSFLEDKTIAELLPVEENKTDEDPKVFWNN